MDTLQLTGTISGDGNELAHLQGDVMNGIPYSWNSDGSSGTGKVYGGNGYLWWSVDGNKDGIQTVDEVTLVSLRE